MRSSRINPNPAAAAVRALLPTVVLGAVLGGVSVRFRSHLGDAARAIELVNAARLPGPVGKGAQSTLVQGVGGAVEMPPGFLAPAYEAVRAAGGVCISDEVQTGFGRLGDSMFGIEQWGVEPDIMTMAKGIANGLPLGNTPVEPANRQGSQVRFLHGQSRSRTGTGLCNKVYHQMSSFR